MDKLIPVGKMLLVKPLNQDNFKTQSGFELVDLTFKTGEIIELPESMEHIYEKGDSILYSANSGHLQPYNGDSCLWLNGNGYPEGDVWAIIKKD